MSYNLTRTDGTPLLTLADGQTNTTATSLVLIGKNYAGYGTFLNENFVKLLESFSGPTAPENPSQGQLWWQSSTKLLKVYIGNNTWKSISGAQAEASAPTFKTTGDLWFDTTNQQLKVWSGANWITIGPSFTQTTGTSGAVADTIVDDALFTHVAVKFFVQNSLVAILSKDSTYTPGNAIPGFSTIKPGLNLATGTAPGLKYWTTAENADFLGNVPAANYLRSDVSVPITTPLEIRNLLGLYIAEPNGTIDFTLGVASNFVNLTSLVRGNGMKLIVKPDNTGTFVDALTVDKFTGRIRVAEDPTDALGIATKNYVDNGINTLTSATNSNITILSSQIQNNVAAINSNIGNIALLAYTGTVPSTGNVVANIRALSGNVGSMTLIAHQTSITANIQSLAANIGWTGKLSSDDLTITGNIENFATNVGPMSRIAHQTSITANIQSLASNIGWTGRLSSDDLTVTGNIAKLAANVGDINSTRTGNQSVTANIQAIWGNIAGSGGGGGQPIGANLNAVWGNIGPLTQTSGQGVSANLNALWGNIGGVPLSGGAGGTWGGQTVAANTTAIWGNIGTISAASTGSQRITANVQAIWANIGGVPTAGPATAAFGGQTMFSNITAVWGNINTLSTTLGGVTGDTSTLLRNGTRSIQGVLVPDGNNTRDFGSTGARFAAGWFNSLYGTLQTASQTNITGVGTLTSGTWQASSISTTYTDAKIVSVTGTTNRVTATTSAGAVTITAPQDIHTAATPTFGGITIPSITKSGTNGSGDIGQTGNRFGTIWGTASAALYADLAERYEADQAILAGSVVRLGGTKEITLETDEASEEVFGVISNAPAFRMNDAAGDDTTHPFVALSGRVFTRVVGSVRKGQRMISAGNGCARGAKPGEATQFNVIGRALSDKATDGEELIELVVKAN